ncbi:MAG: hypothetical protein AAFV29_14445 [Myxococcota bacterium]
MTQVERRSLTLRPATSAKQDGLQIAQATSKKTTSSTSAPILSPSPPSESPAPASPTAPSSFEQLPILKGLDTGINDAPLVRMEANDRLFLGVEATIAREVKRLRAEIGWTRGPMTAVLYGDIDTAGQSRMGAELRWLLNNPAPGRSVEARKEGIVDTLKSELENVAQEVRTAQTMPQGEARNGALQDAVRRAVQATIRASIRFDNLARGPLPSSDRDAITSAVESSGVMRELRQMGVDGSTLGFEPTTSELTRKVFAAVDSAGDNAR